MFNPFTLRVVFSLQSVDFTLGRRRITTLGARVNLT